MLNSLQRLLGRFHGAGLGKEIGKDRIAVDFARNINLTATGIQIPRQISLQAGGGHPVHLDPFRINHAGTGRNIPDDLGPAGRIPLVTANDVGEIPSELGASVMVTSRSLDPKGLSPAGGGWSTRT